MSEIATGLDPLHDEEFARDPHTLLARARSKGSVFFSPSLDAWCVTRYPDIVNILKDPSTYSSTAAFPTPPPNAPTPVKEFIESLLFGEHPIIAVMDPPTHTDVRQALTRKFTSNALRKYEGCITGHASRIIESLEDRKSFDLSSEFSHPFSLATILELVGLSEGGLDKWQTWLDKLLSLLVASVPPETQLEYLSDVQDCAAFVRDVAARRRRQPQDDLLTAMIRGEIGRGVLSMNAVVTQTINLIGAGYETTANALSNTVLQLLSSDRWVNLRHGDDHLNAIIDESLRLEPSVVSAFRVATRNAKVGEKEIRAGELVCLLIASGNRDECVFPKPHDFELQRATRAVTFGRGPHYCLGEMLARMEIRAALKQLNTAFPALQTCTTNPPKYRPVLVYRALQSLVVHTSSTPAC